MAQLKFHINLTKTQKKIYELIHRANVNEVVACLSRQSGKSVIAEVLCIEYLFKVRSRIGYIVPTFSHARKVYNEIVSLIPQDFIKSQNGSTLTVETIIGGKLQFFSAESPVALRGQTFKGLLVIDEAAFISDTTAQGEDFFNSILFATCKANRPKKLIISTPRGKQGWFYKKYLEGFEKHREGDRHINRTFSVKATIYDDDLVSEEEIEEIKKSIGELSFKQEFLCEFLDNGVSAFSNYEDKFTLPKDNINFNEPLWCGIDFSSVGEDKTVVSFINKNNDVFQYQIDGTLEVKYNRIAQLLNKCNKLVMCYAEANGVGTPMIDSIKKLVKNKSKINEHTTTNETKENEVGLLQLKLDKDEIHFEEENDTLMKEFGVFSFTISKTKKITYAAMSGFHDDRVMSLLIALQSKEDYAYSSGSNVVFIKSPSSRMSMR